MGRDLTKAKTSKRRCPQERKEKQLRRGYSDSPKEERWKLTRRSFLVASGVFGASLMGLSRPKKAVAASRAGAERNADGQEYDAVIVGSGINALVAAALLAKEGWRVCVLERNDVLGGCIRTEEITLPGFKHDVLSGFYPLFVTSPAYAELKEGLHQKGLKFANTEYPTAVVMPDNTSLILTTSREENVNAMEALAKGDGKAYNESLNNLAETAALTFGILGNHLWSYKFLRLMLSKYWQMGIHNFVSYFGDAMKSCRTWAEKTFQSEITRALVAPWPLHVGLGPDNALSGFMDRIIFFTLEQVSMPIVKGGSKNLVDAFVKYIQERKGTFVTNADVNKVITDGKKAKGVRTTDGGTYLANKAVVCSVTPTQLYQRFLDPEGVPTKVAKQASEYRYGRGDMQIHLALSDAPQWPDPKLGKVAMVHLSPGLDAVSKAVNQAERGLLSEEPTVVVTQPTSMDATRAPEGKYILWIQLQEVPSNGHIRGDAAGKIKTPRDGKWNESVRERYADRIIDRIAMHVPNLKNSILARTVLSPADLEALNINLVGGDPYAGVCSIDQFFFWRPLRATKNHSTPIENLYHIGASTHPGPGLGGVSGYLAAKALIS